VTPGLYIAWSASCDMHDMSPAYLAAEQAEYRRIWYPKSFRTPWAWFSAILAYSNV
jgi:hypothetical protein